MVTPVAGTAAAEGNAAAEHIGCTSAGPADILLGEHMVPEQSLG